MNDEKRSRRKMMTNYKTNREVAESFELWSEYADPNGEMERDMFDAMSVEDRERLLEEMFGTDTDQLSRLDIEA